MAPEEITVRDAPERERVEILVGGTLAGFAEYQRAHSGALAFVHTEIDPAFEGQGLGSRLAAGALDKARAEGEAVHPVCPFMRGYIARHREYVDLVPAQRRARYDLGPGGG